MVRPLKVGVQLPEVEYEYTWPQLAEMARVAEEVGLDSIWLGDHLMYRYQRREREPRGPFEAWTTLGALAAVTNRVELGPLVASTGFHSPAMIAKKAATIDQISNDHRVSRFEEAFAIIRTLLETGESDFAGEYYTIEGGLLFPKPARAGGIPIMVGSSSPRMLAITLPHVAMWNAWYEDWNNNRDGLARLLERIDTACESAGRDPKTLIRTVCPLVRMKGGRGRISDFPGQSGDNPINGKDPAALAEELNSFAELGVGHVQLVIDPITASSIADLKAVLDRLDV
jgi:alkanesulfonate monooxygenase SsuD/methylene tetrahydromethanopterin reductase-like flavin-dependent oxidoreductase (luciferase family)